MDGEKAIVYYCRLLKFKQLINPVPPDFGLKSDWSKYLDETKYKDKGLQDFIDYLINVGILIEYDSKNNQHPIYKLTEEGLDKVEMLLEKREGFLWLDDTFDITRNPKKGSRLL